MIFDKSKSAAAIEAVADMLKEHVNLLTGVNNAFMDKRTLRDGDVVTIHAGLPDLQSGMIEGQPREWLAFPATVKRGQSEIDLYLGFNSLVRGYYGEDEDILVEGKNGNVFPDSSKLHRRFGEDLPIGQAASKGVQVPFIAKDIVVTMSAVDGYRPVYRDGQWVVDDKTTLIVGK